MKLTFTLFLLNLIVINIFSQTDLYIKNGGFEIPSIKGNFPNNVAQFEKLANWTDRRGTDNAHHSPDWIDDLGCCGSLLNAIPNPHTGYGMAGIGPYEMMQQEFANNQFSDDYVNSGYQGVYYSVSMYIYLPPNTFLAGTRLKATLSKNKCVYQNENFVFDFLAQSSPPTNQAEGGLCDPSYSKLFNSSSDIVLIGSWEMDPAIYLPGNWCRIQGVFKSPSDIGSMHYFNIELIDDHFANDPNTEHCDDNKYLFIDDVEINKAPDCNAACAPNLPIPTVYYYHKNNLVYGVPDAMEAPCYPWAFEVKDATNIELQVFSRWGNLIYQDFATDVNGLKDANFVDYEFGWVGYDNSGNLVPNDVYSYTLRIVNCIYDKTTTGSITLLNGIYDSQCTQKVNTQNGILNDCCVNQLYIQDKYYVNSQNELARDFIIAGSNVNSKAPFGPVEIESGVKVRYVASSIQLKPGFKVDQGANFKQVLTDNCKESSIAKLRDTHRERPNYNLYSQLVDSVGDKFNPLSTAPFFYPNPSNTGVFKITNNNNNIFKSFHIIDIYGKSIGDYYLVQNELNLSTLIPGLYFCQPINSMNSEHYTKLIISK